MSCKCDGFVGNLPPSGVGGGGTPDVFFRATKTDAPQVVSDDTETTVSFNNESYDNGSRYVPNTFNAPDQGLHLFEATIDITFQTAGYCRVWFDLGGGGVISEDRRIVDGAEQQVFNLTALIHLAQFNLIQVRVRQVTGNTASIATGITRFNGAQLRKGAAPQPI